MQAIKVKYIRTYCTGEVLIIFSVYDGSIYNENIARFDSLALLIKTIVEYAEKYNIPLDDLAQILMKRGITKRFRNAFRNTVKMLEKRNLSKEEVVSLKRNLVNILTIDEYLCLMAHHILFVKYIQRKYDSNPEVLLKPIKELENAVNKLRSRMDAELGEYMLMWVQIEDFELKTVVFLVRKSLAPVIRSIMVIEPFRIYGNFHKRFIIPAYNIYKVIRDPLLTAVFSLAYFKSAMAFEWFFKEIVKNLKFIGRKWKKIPKIEKLAILKAVSMNEFPTIKRITQLIEDPTLAVVQII